MGTDLLQGWQRKLIYSRCLNRALSPVFASKTLFTSALHPQRSIRHTMPHSQLSATSPSPGNWSCSVGAASASSEDATPEGAHFVPFPRPAQRAVRSQVSRGRQGNLQLSHFKLSCRDARQKSRTWSIHTRSHVQKYEEPLVKTLWAGHPRSCLGCTVGGSPTISQW